MINSIILMLALAMPQVTDEEIMLEKLPDIIADKKALLIVNVGMPQFEKECRELATKYGAYYMQFPLWYNAVVNNKVWRMYTAGISLYQSNGQKLEVLERYRGKPPTEFENAVPKSPYERDKNND